MRDMKKKSAGFTLIEMLVGIVIGMIVVAAASVMMVSVLKSQKDITASARLNQELGAAMAVMSNEIRRAGFSVCDVENSDCNLDGDGIEELAIKYNTSASNKDIEIIGGNCILYRYNADLDKNDDPDEQRGFRLNDDNVIEMAGTTGAVTCTSGGWSPLTDPNVITISDLRFSTTGSKCRNMTSPDPNPPVVGDPEIVARYWVVNSNSEIVMACDPNGDAVEYCVVTEDSITACTSGSKIISDGDQIFGTRQIRITLDAILTRDTAVTKRLESSVKVANPRVHCWPYSEHAACTP